jgi:hypothetical protein
MVKKYAMVMSAVTRERARPFGTHEDFDGVSVSRAAPALPGGYDSRSWAHESLLGYRR